MFFSVAKAIEQFQHVDALLNQTIKNALIESFAIHTRNLIDFLYPRSYNHDDIIAQDFFNNPMEWKRRRGQLSKNLREARERADKEIAHLTQGRISGTPRRKFWDITKVGNEIKEKISIFIEDADRNRLSERVIGFVNSLF